MSMHKLDGILKQYAITQSALAKHAGVSPTVINLLIRQGQWPKKTPHTLKESIEGYLTELEIVFADDLFNFTNSEDSEEIEEIEMHKEMITQDARKLYGIFKDPFTDDVRSHDDVFLTPTARFIRETLYHAASSGGFIAVIAESGAGKSILRRDLVDRINREDASIQLISPSLPDKEKLTVTSIIEAVIDEINPNLPGKRSIEAKSRQMEKLLRDSSRAGMTHCLVIEEAHDLTLPMLKNLKRFWELEDGFKRLLSIVLIGQPELKNKLNERMNWEAREVIRRCEIAELQPLDSHLKDYLIHKFERVGVDVTKFMTDDAFEAIRAKLTQTGNRGLVSMTYPLIVNNLTVKILNHAAEIGATPIDAGIVESL